MDQACLKNPHVLVEEKGGKEVQGDFMLGWDVTIGLKRGMRPIPGETLQPQCPLLKHHTTRKGGRKELKGGFS